MDYISDQQKSIVESAAIHKKIVGCAGSCKTDTLIKCAIRDIATNCRNILYLTKVGSVTDEIRQRLAKSLDVSVNKIGRTNHYIGEVTNDETIVYVGVSTFDAWVDHMLRMMMVQFDGDKFGKKQAILLSELKAKTY